VSNATSSSHVDGGAKASRRSSAWFLCALHGLQSVQTVSNQRIRGLLTRGVAGSESGIHRGSKRQRPTILTRSVGRSRRVWLLCQVVFLFGFDGVMLTIANDHWVQVVMFGLFDFGPSGPAQRIDEEEPGCLTAELLSLDLLL
jgi:hypothetical protein